MVAGDTRERGWVARAAGASVLCAAVVAALALSVVGAGSGREVGKPGVIVGVVFIEEPPSVLGPDQDFHEVGIRRGDPALLDVAGGHVRGRGWLGSDACAGLIHGGDTLELYPLLSSHPNGEIVLTGRDHVASEDGQTGDSQWGLECEARVAVPPQGGMDRWVAAWSSDKRLVPRWLDGEILSTSNEVYRRVITDWLSHRGVSGQVAATIKVTQIVQTDINSDGRREVFLAFETPGITSPMANGKWRQPCIAWEGHDHKRCNPGPTSRIFSYLIMRYLPPHSRTPRTVILDDDSCFGHQIIAFCDVDGDGRAEVISEDRGVDFSNTKLHHWTGSRFKSLDGFGGSA
jgi:hypothetical protein